MHWHNRHVVIHREPVRRYYHGSPRKRVISQDYRRWEHNTVHRRARYSTRVVHNTPSRYEHAGVSRAKHLSNKHVSTVNTAKRHNDKNTVRPIARTESTKTVRRAIEHALKRNQAASRSEKPTRDRTLSQLKRDKPARISTPSESKRYANRENTLKRPAKQNINRERFERTSPQIKPVARESSKPRRIERASTSSVSRAQVKNSESSRNRTIKQGRTEKMLR